MYMNLIDVLDNKITPERNEQKQMSEETNQLDLPFLPRSESTSEFSSLVDSALRRTAALITILLLCPCGEVDMAVVTTTFKHVTAHAGLYKFILHLMIRYMHKVQNMLPESQFCNDQ
jgi:hypothetical protein